MDEELRYLLPAPIRRLPADLAATIVLTVLTVLVVVLPGVRDTPLRVLLGLPYVLFLPGYAFIALLFPEAGQSLKDTDGATDFAGWGSSAAGDDDPGTDQSGTAGTRPSADGLDQESTGVSSVPVERGIDGIERVALSFGLSIAIVPLIGLALNFTPWGIRLTPILVSVSAFTIGCALWASARRRELPSEERFAVPYERWLADARAELFEPADRTDALLNVLLVVSILLAVSSVGYAVAVPKEGEQFTEFYVLTESEDGDLVAAGYPQDLVRGESAELVVGIGNQEHESTDYTVVVELQRVAVVFNDSAGVNETIVRERRELDRFRTTVGHNETSHHPYEFSPEMTGSRLRLQLLLFRGEPPADPTAAAAYRELHLWLTVIEPNSENATRTGTATGV